MEIVSGNVLEGTWTVFFYYYYFALDSQVLSEESQVGDVERYSGDGQAVGERERW